MERGKLMPDYAWDESAARYRDARTGRFIAEAPIRAALDDVLAAQSAQMRALATRLQSGSLTLGEWQGAMAIQVKQAQIIGATAARGGWAALTDEDESWIADRTAGQLEYLQAFAVQIEDRSQKLNGTLLARAALYGQAGRATYTAMRQVLAGPRYDQERSVLGAVQTEHCPGCETEASRGWQPLGVLVPPGARECGANCRCGLVFRARQVGAA